MLWAAAGFGLLAVVLAVIISIMILPPDLLEDSGSLGLGSLLLNMLKVGFIEESVKFIPLAIFLYKNTYFNENVDGVLYFAISGLVFGLLENIMYTLNHGVNVGVMRLVLTPFFHTAGTALIGYYLMRHKLGRIPLRTAIFSFIAIAVLHGLYNFGLASGVAHFLVVSLMIALLLDCGLFIAYMKAKEHDKAEGLSTNKFCQSCGRTNANRTIFCEYCGKKT
jgi:RsiW-degrading membrane proteinase PrsW (M82 family)